MSVTLVGYEGQAPSVQLSQEQQRWFEKMSDKVERDIVIEFCAYGSRTLREDDFDESKVIRIFDAATSGVINPEHGNATQTREALEVRSLTDTTRPAVLPMRVPRMLSRVNTELPRYFSWTNEGEDLDRVDNPRAVAEYDYGTFWSRWPLANYRRFDTRTAPEAAWTSTDVVMDLVLGPIFERILDKDVIKTYQQEREQAARDHFLDHARRNASEQVRTLLSRVSQQEGLMIQGEEQAASARRQMTALQAEYDFHERNAGIDEPKLAREYDEILKHTRLERLEFDAATGLLKFFTDQLYLYSPELKERTPVGKFRIDLRLGDRGVIINNLTNMKGGRNHPHVPAGGHGCWGSVTSLLEASLEKHEILSFFQLSIEYLESYNPEDAWGRWAANWWLTQEDKQQFLQEDGSWLTSAEIKAQSKGGSKKKKEQVQAEDELESQLADGLTQARAQV